MAQIIASMSNSTARFISLNDVAAPSSPSNISALKIIEEAPHSDELIFTFNAQEAFAPADTSSLKAIFGDRLRTFTNIRFDGLHPDITYFGRFGGRWHGSMGEYHSKLIVYSYATGRSEQDCLNLFNGKNYRSLGYFDIWASSSKTLLERDETCEIRFANQFLDLVGHEHCLFSMNHPTSVVFHELTSVLLTSIGRVVRSPGRHNFANPLFGNFIWPVYPEISEQFNLPYRMGMDFFTPMTGEADLFMPRSLSLRELIRAEYAIYGRYPFADFKSAAEEFEFWQNFTEVLG